MRKALLPVATALMGALVGPFAVTFPFSIFIPIGLVAFWVGYPLAAFGGLLFGAAFSLMSPGKLRRLGEQTRVKRLASVAVLGAFCGATCFLLLPIVMCAQAAVDSCELDWNQYSGNMGVALYLAYGGALSALVMWPIVKAVLGPNSPLNRTRADNARTG